MGHIMFIGLLCIVIFAVIGVQCFKVSGHYTTFELKCYNCINFRDDLSIARTTLQNMKKSASEFCKMYFL